MQRAGLTDRLLHNNRYRVGPQIENRGYSTIYKAFDRQRNNELCLLKHTWDVSDGAANRYRSEYDRVIFHDGLPARRDLFRLGNASSPPSEGYGHFTILSWEGDYTLQEMLDHRPDGRLEVDKAVGYVTDICNALDVLHNGFPPIYHKHISPANIIINEQDRAVLRDYGLAYIASPFLHSDSRQVLRGDPFAAPEQLAYSDVADARTDVYRVGAVLYYLVTGRFPTSAEARQRGDPLLRADGRFESLSAWQRQQPREADHLPRQRSENHVPRRLADIIERAMAINVADRYETVRQLGNELSGATRFSAVGSNDDLTGCFVFLFIAIVIGVTMLLLNDQPGNGTTTQLSAPNAAQVNGISEIANAQSQPGIIQPTIIPPTPTVDLAAIINKVDTEFRPVFQAERQILSLSAPQQPAAVDAGLTLANFSASGVFINSSTSPWDYGFAFRHDPVSHYRFVVGSDGSWYVIHVTEKPSSVQNYVASGQSTNLLTGPDLSNQLRILVMGETIHIYINGQYEASGDLSGKPDPGRLFAATGMHPNLSGIWSVIVEDFIVSAPGD
jgi:serine/threonine protein kinase